MVYLLFPVLLLLTIHLQNLQVRYYATRYSTSSVLSLSGFLCLAGFQLYRDAPLDLPFLTDPRFWITQAGLLLFIKVQLKARKLNEKNLTIFNMSSFMVDALVPFTSIMVVWMFSLQNTIEADGRTWIDRCVMSGLIVMLLALFYVRKVQSRECVRPDLLMSNCVLGSVVLMMQGKLIQEYDPYLFQMASSLVMFAVFCALSLRRREYKNFAVKNLNVKSVLELVFCHCVTLLMILVIITQIPAENYTIVRNSGLVLASYVYSQVVQGKKQYNLQDCLILCGIISVAFLL
ncbi:hypothetical protein IFT48_04125 [Pseudomonas fluorescens]|uniref:hypothetical protein n=1 Tax=Pseudomonas TaxID=286 RepID=UPI000F03EDA6|nr:MULTISPECIES: hypothetical protein [Pseudomonas]MBD8089159.1 hypothetical protein [Pseudomonas fluorescens]MBD8615414.1 hypothetical protein [Pseudomonas putida]MBD8681933.1 hypothetical protein [Pseudomonas sp. CFBP 13719]